MSGIALAWRPEVPGSYLDENDPDLAWQERALCTQADPDAWFPEKGASVREPKRICRNCPVRVQCLQYAIENEETHGIWAGLTERDLRAERVSGLVRAPEDILADADARDLGRKRRAAAKQARRNAAEREVRALKSKELAA